MAPPLWINVIKLLPWLKKLNKRVAPNKGIKREGHCNDKAGSQPQFMEKEQKMLNLHYFFMFYWGGIIYFLKSEGFRKFF